jgi:hypothetical protein
MSTLSPLLLDDPQHWRHCAEEARFVAEQMSDLPSKKKMLRIVSEYESLAARTEQRLGAPKSRAARQKTRAVRRNKK